MKLGIGSYCYMWATGFKAGARESRPEQPMSAARLLERAHELGVHVVQYGPFTPLAALDEAQVRALVAQAARWEIELELATRGLEEEHLAQQIELARRIGARLLRTVPELSGASGSARPASVADTVRCVRAVLPRLEAASVSLGLENGNMPALDLKRVIDEVDSPRLGVVLDTANSLAVAEGYQYVAEILAPYTICLHHKEFVVQRVWTMMGFTVEGRPAGQGQVDTPWLLALLQQNGGRAGAGCNLILESWPPELASLDESIALEDRWVEQGVAYLRTLVKD